VLWISPSEPVDRFVASIVDLAEANPLSLEKLADCNGVFFSQFESVGSRPRLNWLKSSGHAIRSRCGLARLARIISAHAIACAWFGSDQPYLPHLFDDGYSSRTEMTEPEGETAAGAILTVILKMRMEGPKIASFCSRVSICGSMGSHPEGPSRSDGISLMLSRLRRFDSPHSRF
jgi:hypothetical protein